MEVEMNSLPVERILEVAGSFGATSVRVFGSWARGEAKQDSDLDLIVDVPRGTTLLDLAGLQIELEKLLGIKVEVLTEGDLHPRLREQILAEARPLVAA
jgi:predicted nucleotidyltransferase